MDRRWAAARRRSCCGSAPPRWGGSRLRWCSQASEIASVRGVMRTCESGGRGQFPTLDGSAGAAELTGAGRRSCVRSTRRRTRRPKRVLVYCPAPDAGRSGAGAERSGERAQRAARRRRAERVPPRGRTWALAARCRQPRAPMRLVTEPAALLPPGSSTVAGSGPRGPAPGTRRVAARGRSVGPHQGRGTFPVVREGGVFVRPVRQECTRSPGRERRFVGTPGM